MYVSLSLSISVYHCDEKGNIHPEDYELTHPAVWPPCILTCCGRGRTNRRPDITFSTGGKRLDGSFLSPTCTYNDTGGFICSTKSLSRCFREKYLCTVSQGNVNQSAEILVGEILCLVIHVFCYFTGFLSFVVCSVCVVCVDQPKNQDGADDGACEPPLITKISVTKLVGNRVLVSWNYTKKNNRPYCVGTRRFRVKMNRYGRYIDATNNERKLISVDDGYLDINERRVTNYTFDGVGPDMFYRFLVRARLTSEVEASAGVQIHYDIPVYSPVQHFALFGEFFSLL